MLLAHWPMQPGDSLHGNALVLCGDVALWCVIAHANRLAAAYFLA